MLSWRKVVAVLVGIVACACLGGAAPPAAAPATERAAAAKLIHLRIRGDLDCMKLARDVARELARVRPEGPSFIVVEMDGDRWRADVVWTIAQEIRATGAPAAALLNDPRGKRVGTGQFILGLLASVPRSSAGSASDPLPCRLFLAPKTIVGLDPGEDLRRTAAEDTDWEAVDRELQGAAWLALKARGVDTELAATCLRPSDSVWAVADEETGRRRLTIKRPETDAGAVQVVELTAALPSPRVAIDGTLAVELGVASTARTVGEVLTLCGVEAHGRTTIEVSSGLASAERDVRRLVESVERAVERARQTLRNVPSSYRYEYELRKRRAGREAGALLEEAAAALVRAEGIIEEYPELLRTNPPTRTSVGQDPGRFRREWRDLFQRQRDEISELAAKAGEYAAADRR